MLSVAMKLVIDTVSVEAIAGMVNAVTVGGVVSGPGDVAAGSISTAARFQRSLVGALQDIVAGHAGSGGLVQLRTGPRRYLLQGPGTRSVSSDSH